MNLQKKVLPPVKRASARQPYSQRPEVPDAGHVTKTNPRLREDDDNTGGTARTAAGAGTAVASPQSYSMQIKASRPLKKVATERLDSKRISANAATTS